MPTPFLLRPKLYLDTTAKLIKDQKAQQAARKAQAEQTFEPTKSGKSIFGKALKLAAGITPDEVENFGKKAWEGVEAWNSQVQSVPAALFTKGKVTPEGQYTTQRNLIGNPLANVASHVKAQRQAGLIDESAASGSILDRVGEGFSAARRAGRAYEEDPDIAAGVKFASGVGLDPTTYLTAGTLSKLPKVAKIGGAKGKLARAPLNILEGFEKPSQVAKFTVGGAIGSQLAENYNVPGVPEGLEQLAGGVAGGIGGLAVGKRGIKQSLRDVDEQLAKFQEREGKPAAIGGMTDVLETGERVYHGSPKHIPEGTFLNSPKGDIEGGFYLTRDPSIASLTAEGDTANATGFPKDFLEERAQTIEREGGQQVYRFRTKRDLFLLDWDGPVDKVESSRIKNALVKLGNENVESFEGLRGYDAVQKIKVYTPNISGVLSAAGFDGISRNAPGYPQLTVFRPNDVLVSDLTPPTIVKGKEPVPATELVKQPGTINQLTQDQKDYVGYLWENNPDLPYDTVESYVAKFTDVYSNKIPGDVPELKDYADAQMGKKAGLVKKPSTVSDIKPNPKMAVSLKSNGYVTHDAINSSSIDSATLEELKQLYDAFEYADSKGWLNETGNKQYDLVLKKLDELEPIKGASKYPLGDTMNPVHVFKNTNGEWEAKIHEDGETVTNLSKSDLEEYLAGEDISYTIDPQGNPSPDNFTYDQMELSKPGHFQAEYNKMYDSLNEEGVTKFFAEMEKFGNQTLVDADYYDVMKEIVADPANLKKTTQSGVVKSVTPEEIVGIKPQQTLDEQLAAMPPSYEKAEYAPPGQEGAPIAGKPKLKTATPIKEGGIWKAAGYSNEDLGDLMDTLTQNGYKVLPPEGIGGGAMPEPLVTPREVTVGLTGGEKVSNAITKITKAIFQHGVESHEVATPIAREYLRINNVVKTQATNIGKLAQRAEKLLGIKNIEEVSLENLTPAQQQVVDKLQYSMDAYEETLKQFDTEFKGIHTFFEDIRYEQGNENKDFSDLLTEYGNAIANKVSDKWLAGEIAKMSETIDMAAEAGVRVPTRTVNIAGAGDIKLPREIGDVLAAAVHKVHPTRDSEFTKLFNAINNTLRGMWAAGDASFFGIQQLPTMADNPKLAGGVIKSGLQTLKDETVFADFVLKHDEAVIGTGKPTITKWIDSIK